VKGILILGIKNFESAEERCWKARLVGGGHDVRDTDGMHVVDALPTAPPTTLDEVRLVLVLGALLHGPQVDASPLVTGSPTTSPAGRSLADADPVFTHKPDDWSAATAPDGREGAPFALSVDVDAAYLHADLEGPPHFLELPVECWPSDWRNRGLSRPVVSLVKAIPGLQQSGPLWRRYCTAVLVTRGWRRIDDVAADLWVKHIAHVILLLVAYVDDLLLVGPIALLFDELMSLKDESDPDKVTVCIGRFGACRIFLGVERKTVVVDGVVVTLCNQYNYILIVVKEFKSLAGVTALKQYHTPMSGEPISNEDLQAPGRFQDAAAHFIGTMMWLARNTRPDLQFCIGFLSRFLTRWCLAGDRILTRAIGYLEHSAELELTSWCTPGDRVRGVSYVDADHAGCPFSARSTTGKCTFLVGRQRTLSLISWASGRQGCAAVATAEAESVGINDALRHDVLPLVATMSAIGVPLEGVQLRADASAAIGAIRRGYSKSMRHLRKVHRVSLAASSDVLENEDGVELVHTPGVRNVADTFTKPLPEPQFRAMREWLGLRERRCWAFPRVHPALIGADAPLA